MRSDLIYDALDTVRNRYLLCQLISKATRKFHKPNTRVQETMNDVLVRVGEADETETVIERAQRERLRNRSVALHNRSFLKIPPGLAVWRVLRLFLRVVILASETQRSQQSFLKSYQENSRR